ncbi:MAG: hypothetical protein Q4C70_06290 [Planctomycetia bacterium]|nr:hypothetical protein [Planctomycetia bacterium]
MRKKERETFFKKTIRTARQHPATIGYDLFTGHIKRMQVTVFTFLGERNIISVNPRFRLFWSTTTVL